MMPVVFSDLKSRNGKPLDEGEIESMMRKAATTAAVVRKGDDWGEAVVAAFGQRLVSCDGDEVLFIGPKGPAKAVPAASMFPGMVMDALGDTCLAVRLEGIDGTELVAPLEPKQAAAICEYLLTALAALRRAGVIEEGFTND